MPKLDLDSVPRRTGTSYPAPFHEPCAARVVRALGKAGGLTDFGVNLLELPPGAWSSQRHWHTHDEEFAYVVSGEVILITDEGEQLLRSGDAVCFPKGEPNGHHVINRSQASATLLVAGTDRSDDVCSYSDLDMKIESRDHRFVHKDGTPYPERKPL